MRPIEDLGSDACRALRGVVFDIDDTITEQGRVTAEAYAALWRLADAGLTLVAVTGRPLGWCDVAAQLWPVALAVGENGAGWVWREGARLRDGFWDEESVRGEQRMRTKDLIELVAQRFPGLTLAGDQRLRRVDLAFDVNEAVRLPPATVQALVAFLQDQGARVLVSSVHVHVFFGTHDKAAGVVRAAEQALGQDVASAPARWLFVGDSGNDASAFAYFPISAGVANVRDHLDRLPTPPAFVARGARGRGFAEIADLVLSRRG